MSNRCSKCNTPITDGVNNYSMDNFGVALCMQHQKGKEKIVETKDEKISDLLRATPEALRLKIGLSDRGWKVIHEDHDEHKHVDLAIHAAKIVIEVDGSHHNSNSKQGISDIKRTFHDFVDKDIITLRIPNSVMNDNDTIDEAVNVLHNLLKERVKKLEKEVQREKIVYVVKVILFVGFVINLYYFLENIGLTTITKNLNFF